MAHLLHGKEIVNADAITLDIAESITKKIDPLVWSRVCTKFIDGPSTHYPYKAVPVALASAIIAAISSPSGKDGAANNVSSAAAILERYNYPTYYVNSSLLEALQHTTPPDLSWNELKLPFSGLVFMLPRGAVQEPESCGGKDLLFVGVAKFEPGEEVRIPGTNVSSHPIGTTQEARITIFWALAPNALILQDCTFPISQKLTPDSTWIDQKTEEYRSITHYGSDSPDGKFSARIAGLLANILMVMQARPEYVELGSRIGKKKLKSGIPVYSPTFIGRKYVVIQKQKSESTGAHFTEIGWRAGHWKQQHFGAKSEQTKVIFVDPYIAFMRGLKMKA